MTRNNFNLNNKIKVAVLYGGRSSEHEVSLASATNITQNLDKNKFDVIPIGISKQGTWFLSDDYRTKELQGPLLLKEKQENMLFTPNFIGRKTPIPLKDLLNKQENSLFDVVFPAIHGPLCEDGTIQGLLEIADIPYVGCGVLASAIGMEKDIAKRLVHNAGVNVSPYIAIKLGQWQNQENTILERIQKELKLPVFVKPANTGSSVGIIKVKKLEDLKSAIENAFLYDTKILIEEGIDAIELEISVLEALNYGDEPIVSIAGEIRPQNGHEFYSYAAKYLDEDGAAAFIPADIPSHVQTTVQQIAKIVFKTLECEGMARVDFFLEKGTNKIYFNEINTIPGFTKISMYPKLMAASGIEYSTLLTHLIDLAISRHARKNLLSREFVTK